MDCYSGLLFWSPSGHHVMGDDKGCFGTGAKGIPFLAPAFLDSSQAYHLRRWHIIHNYIYTYVGAPKEYKYPRCNQNLCRMVSLNIVNSWSSLLLRWRRRQICDPFRSQYQISNWEIQRKGNQGAATGAGWTPWRLHHFPTNAKDTSREQKRYFLVAQGGAKVQSPGGWVCACLGAWRPTRTNMPESFMIFYLCLLSRRFGAQ